MGPHAACFLPGELCAEAGGRQGTGLVPPEAVGGKDEPLAGRSHTKGGWLERGGQDLARWCQ